MLKGRGGAIGLAAVAGLGGYYLYTEYAGCTYKGEEDLKGQVFILTGATNPGVGKETARAIAKRGGSVILGAKNLDRCHQARQHIISSAGYANREIDCDFLDLKSLKSIRKFVEKLPKDLKLTALINTAETVKKDQREETQDGLEKQMGVSHFGHFLLTNLLIEKYKNAGKWRIISTTFPSAGFSSINFKDINSEFVYQPSAVYKQAKLATLLTTLELSRRLRGTSITASAVYPGLCNTEVYRHVAGNQPFFIKVLLQPALMFLFTSPEKAAQSVVFAALSPELVDVSGKYIKDCRVTDLPKTVDDQTARQLWEVSEKVVENPVKFIASQSPPAK